MLMCYFRLLVNLVIVLLSYFSDVPNLVTSSILLTYFGHLAPSSLIGKGNVLLEAKCPITQPKNLVKCHALKATRFQGPNPDALLRSPFVNIN